MESPVPVALAPRRAEPERPPPVEPQPPGILRQRRHRDQHREPDGPCAHQSPLHPLDHDGRVVTESTVICEYLEDAFPDCPVKLRPADPYAVAQMRVWTKWVDEYFCWCVSTLGWERVIGPMARALSDEEFEEKMRHVTIPEQVTKWRNARAGFPKDVLDEEMRKVRISIAKLEARLAESPWLAGPDYTLADVCNFAIANGMQFGFSDVVNANDTPHLLDWIHRINDRPAAQAMFANSKRENLAPRKEVASA